MPDTRRRTWKLERFDGGIDLHTGTYSRHQNRFSEAHNCYTDRGYRLNRRPPIRQFTGTFDRSRCQGLLRIHDRLCTIACKERPPLHTGQHGTQVRNMLFDPPPYTSITEWELTGMAVTGGILIATIRHRTTSAHYPWVTYIHVWDGDPRKPTWVDDAFAPGAFGPSWADIGEGRAVVYDAAARPPVTAGTEKVWVPRLNGDVAFSKTSYPRVWDRRTEEDLAEDGITDYRVLPAGDLAEFVIYEDYDSILIGSRMLPVVVEWFDTSTRLWSALNSAQWGMVGTPVADPQNPVHTFQRWTKLTVRNYPATAGLVRITRRMHPNAREVQPLWYERRMEYLRERSGYEDAGFLPCSRMRAADAAVTGLVVTRTMLLVQDEASTQMWAIDPVPAYHGYLDQLPVGASRHKPLPVAMGGGAILPVGVGFRFLAPGTQTQNLRDDDFGLPISPMLETISDTGRTAAAFWPDRGQYITQVTQDGQPKLLVFDYSQTAKIQAWWTWDTGPHGAVDPWSLVPFGDRLYFLSASGLAFFDYAATEHADMHNGTMHPYTTRLVFRFNDFTRPGVHKKVVGMDIEQIGDSQVGFRLVPHNAAEGVPVRYAGISFARKNIPLAMRVHGLAAVVETDTVEAWRLESLSFHYMFMER